MSLGIPSRPIFNIEQAQNYVWDPNTLAWVAEQQPWIQGGGAGAVTIADGADATQGSTSDAPVVTNVGGTVSAKLRGIVTLLAGKQVISVSGSVSSSGNNTIITPSGGKSIRVYYVAYNPSASCECAFRFGTSGGLFLRNNLTQGGSVVAKDYGDFRYIQGAVDEVLTLNLTNAVTTIWNVNYIEV